MHSRASLRRDFEAIRVAAGDVVMLHASVRSVGPVAGGPDEIHLALKDALTNEGTLMMYAGCPRYFDEAGRGNLTEAEEREVLDKLPPFDARTARAARDHGVLVEMLRTWEGSRVNDHVARFVRWGRRAFLHYTEHVADLPDRKIVRFRVPVREQGGRAWKWMAEVDTNAAPDGWFAEIVGGYLRATANDGGRVGDAPTWLMSARGLHEYARGAMERAARPL